MMTVIIVSPIHNPHFARMELIRRRQIFLHSAGPWRDPTQKWVCARFSLGVRSPALPNIGDFPRRVGVLLAILVPLRHDAP